jgi:peptidoglycan hydrolase-like protein with peptidoglycan-binding domain
MKSNMQLPGSASLPALKVTVLLVGMLCLLAACTGKSREEREREAAEEVDKSIPQVEATALAQTIPEEIVKEVQRNLAAIHEYQGEINGVLDSVTLNALEAFQRSIDAPDNGIIDEEIRRKLGEAAQKSS